LRGLKVAKKFVLFLPFSKQPEVNNRPIGENSPNMVTLPPIYKYTAVVSKVLLEIVFIFSSLYGRVAKWYIFKPKIPICILYGHLEYFTVIWYILRSFGKF
jgi:hypothetical protein